MKNLFYIIMLLIIFINNMNALSYNNDSLKNKYELNDPRNPQCPCHKFQKLADEEFEQLLHQSNVYVQRTSTKNYKNQTNTFTQTTVTNNLDVAVASNNAKSKHFKNLISAKHKNKSYKIFGFNKGSRCKKRHHLRSNKNISTCFRWR